MLGAIVGDVVGSAYEFSPVPHDRVRPFSESFDLYRRFRPNFRNGGSSAARRDLRGRVPALGRGLSGQGVRRSVRHVAP